MVSTCAKEPRQTKASCECHRKHEEKPAAYPEHTDETTAHIHVHGHQGSPLENSGIQPVPHGIRKLSGRGSSLQPTNHALHRAHDG
jgi:hypothetical protein